MAVQVAIGQGRNYDVGPDGRFVALKRVDLPNSDHQIHVILNWASTLHGR